MSLFKKIDILAIGDLATEPFIKIKEAEIEKEIGEEDYKLCLDYGGKILYESAIVCHAVGNSANVAIATSRLGLNSYLLSYIGKDNIGKENIDKLKKENVYTDYINTVKGFDSNYHYVLWYKGERTILVKHTEFPYSLQKELKKPKWIYLSSLAQNSIAYHKEISDYIISHPEVFLAFQPGTFQIKFGTEALKDIYLNTKVFFCNHEEAEKILGTEEKDILQLTKKIYNLGPKIVIITDGINGSYSYDGKETLFMKAFWEESKTLESTGAGDAFSGAFITALILGKEIREALVWGTVNAMSVVQYIGPHEGLLNKEKIEEYIKNLPEESSPIKID